MTKRITLFTALILCSMAISAGEIYQITFTEQSGAKMLNVDFQKSKPSATVGEKVLRSSLDAAVAVDSSQNIVATLFFHDKMVRDDEYTSQIVYVAKDKKIVSFSEYLEKY